MGLRDGDGAGAAGLGLEGGERIAARRRLVRGELLERLLGRARGLVIRVVVLTAVNARTAFSVCVLVSR